MFTRERETKTSNTRINNKRRVLIYMVLLTTLLINPYTLCLERLSVKVPHKKTTDKRDNYIKVHLGTITYSSTLTYYV